MTIPTFLSSTDWLVATGTTVLVALMVLVVGWWASGFLSRRARKYLPRLGRLDATLTPVVSQIIRYGVLVVTMIVVLSQFGVQTASILAVLGAAGIAVALALQGTLSNLAAGLMLIWLRPFNVGEAIDAEGISGDVIEIGLFLTRLKTYDGTQIYAPNSKLWASRITNFSREPRRMVELKLMLDLGVDIADVRDALLALAAADPRVLEDPLPTLHVGDIVPGAIQVVWRFWTPNSAWWNTRIQLLERAKLKLDEMRLGLAQNTSTLRLELDTAARLTLPATTPPPEGGSVASSDDSGVSA